MDKLTHYFLIAFRNFKRNKLHALINLLGLVYRYSRLSGYLPDREV